jgi:WD40 repeat protein
VLTGSTDSTARLWEIASGKPVGPALEHPKAVTNIGLMQQVFGGESVGFSPDGKWILTASIDNTARIWKLPAPWDGAPERIALTVIVQTGMEVDESGTIRLLDAETWRQRRQQLERLGGPVD